MPVDLQRVYHIAEGEAILSRQYSCVCPCTSRLRTAEGVGPAVLSRVYCVGPKRKASQMPSTATLSNSTITRQLSESLICSLMMPMST